MNKVKSLNLTSNRYGKCIAVINKLAALEDRFPHAVASRLLIEAGNQKIAEHKALAKQKKLLINKT